MKSFVLLAICAVAIASPYYEEINPPEASAPVTELEQESAEEFNLLQAVEKLRHVAPQEHADLVEHIHKHAELLQQSKKAKAYKHNWNKSKAAITAAIKSLGAQLSAGHTHDKNMLAKQRKFLNGVIAKAAMAGMRTVGTYRNRACPTKRAEEAADRKKKAALAARGKHENKNICRLGTTWGDMEVDKATPKFGTELRSAWDKARATWVKMTRAYNAAVAAHKSAKKAHEKAMAAFKTSLGLESSNAYNACLNAHKEYEALKKEVASNVRTRKQTFIASLVITCYIDNLTSRKSAKACADKKRKSSTSMWDITPGKLGKCPSKSVFENKFGPKTWRPTTTNCKGGTPSPTPSRGSSSYGFSKSTRTKTRRV